MKFTSELKREANAQAIELELQPVGNWKDGLPERLQGWRKAVKANTVGIQLLRTDGKISHLDIKAASLVDYDGETLTIYRAGERDFTEAEKKIMDEWQAITQTEKYKKEAWADAMTDGSQTYWKQVRFFEQRNAKYLMGLDWQRGCKYNWNSGKVTDQKVKGEIELQYKVRKVGVEK